jgi:hypothetical protein
LIGEIDKQSRAVTRGFRAIFINVTLLSSFATRVAAGPFEDATAAMERRDYATALRLCAHSPTKETLTLKSGSASGILWAKVCRRILLTL